MRKHTQNRTHNPNRTTTHSSNQIPLFPKPCLPANGSASLRPKPTRSTFDTLIDVPTGTPAANQADGLSGPHIVPCFSLRLVREKDHLTEQVTSPADAARVCCELLDGRDREVFLVLALSTANRIIGAHAAHTGTLDASIASPREVFKFALLCNARSVLCAHNHPSGNLEPSRADVQVSKQMKAAGETLSIPLVDSLVVTFDGRYTSLAERGLL